MKSIISFFTPVILLITGFSMFTACDQVDDILNTQLSEEQVSQGLKEALRVGTDTSVSSAGTLNGFFANTAIKILFPEEAKVVKDVVEVIPFIGEPLVSEFVKKMNRAAEEAAPLAKDIFVDAITGLTIQDAFNILNGGDDAATQYLRGQTSLSLYNAFYPIVDNAMTSVGANTAWTSLTDTYNNVPGTSPVNTDISDYTTEKALDGLFHLVAEEEGKIRQDPLHRVTEILQTVFGEQGS